MVESSSKNPRTRSPTPMEDANATAKEFTLDIPRIPSVELPLKVSAEQASVQKAIRMCGGLHKVKKSLSTHNDSDEGLELYLNQGLDKDGSEVFFNEHPIIGKRTPQRDESIILKVSLPKGTLQANGNDIRKAISSIPSCQSRITPVAIVNTTIKFREMSDFQTRLDNVPSANEFKRSFGSLDWSNFKKYVDSIPDNDPRPFENINGLVIDRTSGIPNSDFQLPPPPRFSMISIPYVYKYKGNPYSVKTSTGESKVKGSYLKNYQQFVHDFSGDSRVPTAPHPELSKDYEIAKKTGIYPGSNKESQFFEKLEKCLGLLQRLFDKRPVWVKRHIDGIVEQDLQPALKIALSLVSYRFTKGPWRNTYIKLGIDPRDSPEFAKYQTEYFKIERKLAKAPITAKNIPKPPPAFYESDTPGEIDSRFKFNGRQIPWYLMLQIDLLIDEPNIADVYSKAKYLEKPNELTGWFQELDLAKIRRIVKYELGCMVRGNYKFSEYKLKFFKNMLYVKESVLLENTGDAANARTNIDADGDVQMDEGISESRINEEEDEDEDNGVETGEIDDAVLEAEEADEEDGFTGATAPSIAGGDGVDDEDLEEDNFDIKSASFKEVVDRIGKLDHEAARMLADGLKGYVHESQL